VVLEGLVEVVVEEMLVAIRMDRQERIRVLMILMEVRLRQVVEQASIAAVPLEALVVEEQFQQAVMVVAEVGTEVGVEVRWRAGQMAIWEEQVEMELHSRLLATMEEMPKHTVMVEMEV
jgi:hypothetical protein